MKNLFSFIVTFILTFGAASNTNIAAGNPLAQRTLTVELYTKHGYNSQVGTYGTAHWLNMSSTWKTDGTKAQIIDAINELAPILKNNTDYNHEYLWVFKTLVSSGQNRAAIYLYPDASMQNAAALTALQDQLITVINNSTLNNGGVVTRSTYMSGTLSLQIVSQF